MNWITSALAHPIFWVGLGGAVGSNARYGVTCLLNRYAVAMHFPIATTLVNLIGSMLLGCIVGATADRTQTVYLVLGVGFCGGFTTFSTFSLELVEHLQQGRPGLAIAVCLANVVLGMLALLGGYYLCK
jgi:CrcB protein